MEPVRSWGFLFFQSLLVCISCTVQSKTVYNKYVHIYFKKALRKDFIIELSSQ
jgi:hypothetical protein